MPSDPNTIVPMSLSTLGEGIDNLSPVLGAALAEAGSVCLDSHDHKPSVLLQCMYKNNKNYMLDFGAVDNRTLASWNDPEEATEYGATGVALLIARDLLDLKVIQRSAKGGGYDWYLGTSMDALFDSDKCVRLEISGIRSGTENTIRSRVAAKVDQLNKSQNEGTPGFAAVIEFSNPLAVIEAAP